MSKYSLEFKLKVVEEYLDGKSGGIELIARKYNIPFGLIFSFNDVDRKTRQPEEGTIVYLQKKKKSIVWGDGLHVVEKGESMHDISQKYGIRLHSLYDLNKMPSDKY